jgi:hypothetical protein
MTGIPHGPGSGDAAADGHELGDAQSLAAAINEEVSLHPPDPAWFTAFELERTRLQALLPGVFVRSNISAAPRCRGSPPSLS